MSVPTAGPRHLVLVGATGMVGGYALRYALEHPAVERVTAIGRRTLGISDTKLNEILHPNFGIKIGALPRGTDSKAIRQHNFGRGVSCGQRGTVIEVPRGGGSPDVDSIGPIAYCAG
jgi:hypothetical protein